MYQISETVGLIDCKSIFFYKIYKYFLELNKSIKILDPNLIFSLVNCPSQVVILPVWRH
jgi:hypothetical protein